MKISIEFPRKNSQLLKHDRQARPLRFQQMKTKRFATAVHCSVSRCSPVRQSVVYGVVSLGKTRMIHCTTEQMVKCVRIHIRLWSLDIMLWFETLRWVGCGKNVVKMRSLAGKFWEIYYNMYGLLTWIFWSFVTLSTKTNINSWFLLYVMKEEW